MPDAPEATRVEFRLLGPLTISAADGTVSLPGAAERALLPCCCCRRAVWSRRTRFSCGCRSCAAP